MRYGVLRYGTEKRSVLNRLQEHGGAVCFHFRSRLCYMSSVSVVSVFPGFNFESQGTYIILA